MTEESDRCQSGAPVGAAGRRSPRPTTSISEVSATRAAAPPKTRVVAAAERHRSGRMGAVAMDVASRISNAEAKPFRGAHIALGAQVYTDDTLRFPRLRPGRTHHVATVTGGKCPERDILQRQYVQSQPRLEGDVQDVLAQASGRLSRCPQLDRQSPPQHERHDRRGVQRCRKLVPALPATGFTHLSV